MVNSFVLFSFRFKEVASKSKDDLVTLGFPEFTIEDFHETVRLLKAILFLQKIGLLDKESVLIFG